MCHHATRTRSSRPERVDRSEPVDHYRAFTAQAIRLGTAVIVCVAIWALTGAGYFWPGWIIAIGGLRLGFEARARFNGGDSDVEPVDSATDSHADAETQVGAPT